MNDKSLYLSYMGKVADSSNDFTILKFAQAAQTPEQVKAFIESSIAKDPNVAKQPGNSLVEKIRNFLKGQTGTGTAFTGAGAGKTGLINLPIVQKIRDMILKNKEAIRGATAKGAPQVNTFAQKQYEALINGVNLFNQAVGMTVIPMLAGAASVEDEIVRVADVVDSLIRIANELDKMGFVKEADEVDNLLTEETDEERMNRENQDWSKGEEEAWKNADEFLDNDKIDGIVNRVLGTYNMIKNDYENRYDAAREAMNRAKVPKVFEDKVANEVWRHVVKDK